MIDVRDVRYPPDPHIPTQKPNTTHGTTTGGSLSFNGKDTIQKRTHPHRLIDSFHTTKTKTTGKQSTCSTPSRRLHFLINWPPNFEFCIVFRIQTSGKTHGRQMTLSLKKQCPLVHFHHRSKFQRFAIISFLMFSLFLNNSQRVAVAFAPRILSRNNNVVQRFKRPIFQTALVAQRTKSASFSSLIQLEAAKSAYGFRSKSLVVHGPPDFDSKKMVSTSNRPFKLVIVESPSKCETISKILQAYVEANNLEYDFVVTSCMGHIRNLPKKKEDKSQKIPGVDIDNYYRPTYEILPESEGLVEELIALTGKADQLVLATDDDREGEAMAWHLLEVLGENNDLQQPLRVRFTEITAKAIVNSIENAETSLRHNLVQAQETRRILDRLAGFTVSPILWKKIAPGLSAGRVQSVGMALIVQRERERLAFHESEYWDLQGDFSIMSSDFQGQLIAINGQTLASGGSDFDPSEANKLAENSKHKVHLVNETANELAQRLRDNKEEWIWTIANVTSTKRTLKPSPPFITSTLQQESNRRLGMSVSRTMQAAQQLYEKGYISYMRTDSTRLSDDAKQAVRSEITTRFGGDFYQTETAAGRKTKKSKGNNKPEAQDAHEAIRPAIQENGGFASPSDLPSEFDGAAIQLYELIYQRTVAAHMPPQISNSTSVRILGETADDDETSVLFKASGSIVISPGYTLLYPRMAEKDTPLLPALQEGQRIDCEDVAALVHTTQPPPRYTEASFVQELEARGVGRPSTYAGTVKILRDRAYVGSPVTSDSSRGNGVSKILSGSAISAARAAGGEDFTGSGSARGPLVPSLTAFVVCSLFEKHCDMYVDSSFTARMEERLDKIANAVDTVGEEERFQYLDEFYSGDGGLVAKVKGIEENVEADDARRAILPSLARNETDDFEIGLFVGPWGPYIKKIDNSEEKGVTAQLPGGMASDLSTITRNSLKNIIAAKEENGSILGVHPDTGKNIRLKVGRFGAFLQCGEDGEDGTSTHTLPFHLRNLKTIAVDPASGDDDSLSSMLGITFEDAVQYSNLPRTVCTMNDLPILASIGPYGPYLKYNNTFLTLKPADGDVLTIEPDLAQTLVTDGIVNKKSKSGAGVLAELGEKDGSEVVIKSGRFGSYINWKRVNAKLPSQYLEDPSTMPLEEAWELICEKAAKGPSTRGKKGKKGSKVSGTIDLPAGPKRAISAYLHFCAEKRPEVAASMKSLGATSKELARLWKDISDEERQPYVELAEKGKAEYEEKKKVWLKECDELLAKNGQKARKEGRNGVRGGGANNGPKRPRSSYVYFCGAKRDEVKENFGSLGEISKELGRLWSEATESERKEFEDMAAEDRLRYEREKNGETTPGTETITIAKRGGKKKSSSTPKKVTITKRGGSKKRSASKTKKSKSKRGPSAYILFCAAHRGGIVDENGDKLPLGETTKRLAEMWHACDDATKEKFQNEAAQQKVMA